MRLHYFDVFDREVLNVGKKDTYAAPIALLRLALFACICTVGMIVLVGKGE